MVSIFKNYEELSAFAAAQIISMVQHKPAAVLCLAAGNTPRLTYQKVVALANEKGIDFSAITFIGLDEWMGIAPAIEGSCFHFLNQLIFAPLSIQKECIHFFDAIANDPEAACKRINAIISEKGGIDLTLVGIGINGHIGFNEPGIDPNLGAHVVVLDAVTSKAGQKYFKETRELTKGITLGMAQIMASRKVLLLANGKNKTGIIHKTLRTNISVSIPASFIREHPNGLILLDEEAAGELV